MIFAIHRSLLLDVKHDEVKLPSSFCYFENDDTCMCKGGSVIYGTGVNEFGTWTRF